MININFHTRSIVLHRASLQCLYCLRRCIRHSPSAHHHIFGPTIASWAHTPGKPRVYILVATMQSLALTKCHARTCSHTLRHEHLEAWQQRTSTACSTRSAAPSPALHNRNCRLGDLQTCQAHPRRVAKVASQIKREIGDMLIMDDVLATAVCPERRRGFDGALSALASVTDVYVSNDLQFVRAYISVYSDPEGRGRAMENLKRLEPYVRAQIGQRMKLRLTPEVRFEWDESMEEYEALEAALGKEEMQRYQREAREEAGLPPDEEEEEAPSTSSSSAAAAAAEQGQAEDDGGFFDDVEEAEDDGSWELEEYGAWANRPGPFDDLFGGSASGPLIQERKQRKGGRKPGKGKKGPKKVQQQQQQTASPQQQATTE